MSAQISAHILHQCFISTLGFVMVLDISHAITSISSRYCAKYTTRATAPRWSRVDVASMSSLCSSVKCLKIASSVIRRVVDHFILSPSRGSRIISSQLLQESLKMFRIKFHHHACACETKESPKITCALVLLSFCPIALFLRSYCFFSCTMIHFKSTSFPTAKMSSTCTTMFTFFSW